MAFPLVVNPVSASVEVISVSNVIFPLDLNVVRTTNWGNSISNVSRSAVVEIIFDQHSYQSTIDILATLRHSFAGIGSGSYLPSYPQLDRNTTNFPHAF